MIIEPGLFITTTTTLTMAFDQFADDVLSRFCRVTPFKPESHQVHAQQAVLYKGLPCKDRLITYDNAMFVDAGFRPPHPERAA